MYKSKGQKNISIQKVKDYFIEHKYATKSEIASATKLSHATITNILKELVITKYIEQVEDCKSTGGRKAKRYKICGAYMLFGLLHLSVENGSVVAMCQVVDLDWQVVDSIEHAFVQLEMDDLVAIVNGLKAKNHFQYLAISMPGIVDNGKVTSSDIEGLENMDVQTFLEKHCQVHVMIENDVNTAMLGYIHIHQVESKSIAFVYQPDNHYSGCGLYINNAILYGATNFAGELAFLPGKTLQEQKIMLEENPVSLLVSQVTSIIAICNPSLVILYVPCIENSQFLKQIKDCIPKQHLPSFTFINNMDTYVFEGLACLCIENSRYQGKEE